MKFGSKQKKILFVGEYFPSKVQGAPNKVTEELYNRLRKSEFILKFFIYFQDGSKYTIKEKLFGYNQLSNEIYQLGIIPLFIELFKFRPNIIQICSLAKYYIPIVKVAKIFGSKVFTLLHNINRMKIELKHEENSKELDRVLLIERETIQISDIIQVLSKREEQLLFEYFDIKKQEIKINRNGINLLEIKKTNFTIGDKIKIITIGSTKRKEKRIEHIIELLSLSNKNFLLTICYFEEQVNIFNELPKNIEVEFLDPLVEVDLRKELAKHDFYISLAEYESFGIALLEAMNVGLPFIATERIGITELLPVELKKFVVKYNSISEAFNMLNVLISMSEIERKSLSKNIQTFSKSFSWDNVVNEYLDTYHE